MKIGFSLSILLVAALLPGCQSLGPAPPPRLTNIIPAPASVTVATGHFTVSAATRVMCAQPNADCTWVADYFIELVKRSRGMQLLSGTGDSPKGSISLRLSAGMAPEAYRLDIASDAITITASSRAGLIYGAVSLWQLLTESQSVASSVQLAALHITDAPRFAMR